MRCLKTFKFRKAGRVIKEWTGNRGEVEMKRKTEGIKDREHEKAHYFRRNPAGKRRM